MTKSFLLTYSASPLMCCRYLHHTIGHFDNVPEPEALLRVMLRREWMSSAFPTALQRLFQVRFTSGCQLFDIKCTVEAVLQAAPGGYFNRDPLSLLPAIECAFQPIAGPADQVMPLVEAAGLLLEACPGAWELRHLAQALNNVVTAEPPTDSTEAAKTSFAQSQGMLASLLLTHCHAPAGTGGFNPEPSLSPAMSANQTPSQPAAPQPVHLAVPEVQEQQQQHNRAAPSNSNLMPQPPDNPMQQQQQPSATPRAPGQAAAVAHGGVLAVPPNLEQSPSEELATLAAATLAAFKGSQVPSSQNNHTNSNSGNGKYRAAAEPSAAAAELRQMDVDGGGAVQQDGAAQAHDAAAGGEGGKRNTTALPPLAGKRIKRRHPALGASSGAAAAGIAASEPGAPASQAPAPGLAGSSNTAPADGSVQQPAASFKKLPLLKLANSVEKLCSDDALKHICAGLKSGGHVSWGRFEFPAGEAVTATFTLCNPQPVGVAAAATPEAPAFQAAVAAADSSADSKGPLFDYHQMHSTGIHADLPYFSTMAKFRVRAAGSAEGAEQLLSQAAMAHKARVVAVAVVMRQLLGRGGPAEPNWGTLGLGEVLADARMGKKTWSSASTEMNATVF
jgi:hypothetical protein